MEILTESVIQSREEQLTDWYVEVFPDVARFIRNRGGDLEEAKDVFQEVLVMYYEKITLEGFQPVVSDKAYLIGMAKNVWFRTRKHTPHEQIEGLDLPEEEEPKTRTERLLLFLKQSGEKCMDLLQSYYYEKLSMKELSDRFGYKSERSTTVQKFKCLEKVREEVKQKSLTYADFLD